MATKAPLARALASVCEHLDDLEARYALVGGLAVSARSEPRFTRDVDVAIAVKDDRAAESCVAALLARGYRLSSTVEQAKTGRLATVRLLPPGRTALVVDLLFASCGIEPEVVKASERIEVLPKLVVPVARTGHLIAMKLLSRDDRERPQDYDDLLALLAVASQLERRRVKTAITQISKRGYARSRDLHALWSEVTKRGG